MTFDNTTIGLLLFYTAGSILALAFAILYWASTRERKKSTKLR